MDKQNGVLVSWLAFNHDPFERERGKDTYRQTGGGEYIQGPTINFLFDPQSPYCGKARSVVMFARNDSKSVARVEETFDEITRRDPNIECQRILWEGEDPTDHETLFAFLREQMPRVRRRHKDAPLWIHASPGTPSMHTIWVLMCEAGFVSEPFTLLKSLRPNERHGRPAVVPIQIGLETFYKRYQQTRPAGAATTSETVFWDPGQFKSQALRTLYEDAQRVARLRVPVLILGERGTGKTTLAGWLRFNSPFRNPKLDKGWPAVACGQYRPETMRAELFGYVKGAFTGAGQKRAGLLDLADGDTLFLDEIGDLGRDTQRLLIKAIEERRFQPLGSQRWKTSSFRLITATNVPLGELRARLDPDFFDRIALVRLRTPPLREMPEDLEWLWHSVFSHVVRESEVTFEMSEVAHEVIISLLRTQTLAGNLRDLYALAWRLVARWHDEPAPSIDGLRRWIPSALDTTSNPNVNDVASEVVRRFAQGAPLDDLLSAQKPLETKTVQRALQRWLAKEIRRVAHQRGISAEHLADVTSKTLREWVKADDA